MESKVCLACGRPFEYRKKWQDIWPEVKYCSAFCKSAKSPAQHMDSIMSLLQARGPAKSICPSEVLLAEDKKNKNKMERVRSAARLLADQGKIEITQKGAVVNPQNFKGPIRLRLKK